MPTEETRRWCSDCGAWRLARRQTPNHLVHLLVTLFLCGLWLPVWIGIAITGSGPWRCTRCGFRTHHSPDAILPPLATRTTNLTTSEWLLVAKPPRIVQALRAILRFVVLVGIRITFAVRRKMVLWTSALRDERSWAVLVMIGAILILGLVALAAILAYH